MTLHEEPITVSFEEYDPSEFTRWCANDPEVVEKRLNRVGYLNRSPDTVRNQLGDRMNIGRKRRDGGGYNYVEWKYAELLVDRGWPKDSIVNENYYLCRRALETSSEWKGRGCALVRRIFSDAFFLAFDKLIDKNSGQVPKIEKLRNVSLDLFAVGQFESRAGLWEVKRHGVDARDNLMDHQRAALAFTTYLAREFRDSMLKNPAATLEVGLVAFLPYGAGEDDRQRAVAPTDRYCEFSPLESEDIALLGAKPRAGVPASSPSHCD